MNKSLTREEWLTYLDTTWKECLNKAWDKDMTQDEIIAMAREAGAIILDGSDTSVIERLVQLVQAAERNKLAAWMIAQGYATGHGETMEGLLEELEREVGFKRAELWIKRISEAVLAEREACAKVCDHMAARCNDIRAAALESAAENIRSRGDKT